MSEQRSKVYYECHRIWNENRSVGEVVCTAHRYCYLYPGGELLSANRNNLKNLGIHSPDGFEMGYGGSGPADLALTIMCDYFGISDDVATYKEFEDGDAQLAWNLHQALKTTALVPNKWHVTISGDDIKSMIDGYTEGLKAKDG